MRSSRAFGIREVVALLLGAIGFVICIVLVVIPGIQRGNQQARFRKTFGDALPGLCENPPREAVDGEMPASTKVIVVEIESAQVHEWNELVPEAHRALNPDDVDIVICAHAYGEGPRTTIGTCEYTGGVTRTRYQYHPTVIAVDPDSGQALIIERLEGKEPPGCPTSTGGPGDIQGQLPDDQFVDWLRQNIP